MSGLNIRVIIISKCSDPTQTDFYINRIEDYGIAKDSSEYKVITPTNNQSETGLLISQNCLKIETGWYNLIMYDWAYSILENSDIISAITYILNNIDQSTNPWSAAYLGKFMDTCNKYNTFTNTGPFSIVNNSDPAGFHGVLITDQMSQLLYNKLTNPDTVYYSINYALQDIGIDDTSIHYIALSPNLFTYDPNYNAVDINKVYAVKSNECTGTNSEVTPPSDNDLTLFWVLLIIIGVGLIIWFIITSQNESYKIKMKDNNEF
jgi:hypothetical protein